MVEFSIVEDGFECFYELDLLKMMDLAKKGEDTLKAVRLIKKVKIEEEKNDKII